MTTSVKVWGGRFALFGGTLFSIYAFIACTGGTGTMEGGARGLLSWGSVACPSSFDGAAPPADAGCGRPSQHASNTAVNRDPVPEKFTCTSRVTMESGATSVGVSFRAVETQFPEMWPGSLELNGSMGGAVAGPITVGMPLTNCEVRVTEGTHVATGRCGAECTVLVTRYTPDSETIEGTIRCGAMGDDSSPQQFRTVRNADGVPGMAATFSMTGCTPAQ